VIAIAGLATLVLLASVARSALDGASRRDAKRERRTSDALFQWSPRGSAGDASITSTQRSTLMPYFVSPRFVSWLAIGIGAAFLIVATAAFSRSAIMWLAFAISVGTLVASAGICLAYRGSVATLVTGLATALVSAWTVVASLVFSQATVSNLALASALAIAGLAIAGITAHEVSVERAGTRSGSDTGERESRLAAAA
jgi:hypothetical protein